ncbi:MAG: hypothetical protein WD972_02170 [Candidatus Andersenbacteria bacterium]
MTVREPVQALTQTSLTPPAAVAQEELITVSSATKRIAFAYERFRNTLEPDEEDILRRKAIFRILERRLDEDRPPLVTATAIIQELLRAHYVTSASTAFAQRLADLIVRAQVVVSRLEQPVADWFIRMVAVSIDREFYPRSQEEALVRLMYNDTFVRTAWVDYLVEEKERATQLYIACHRSLFAADDHEIAYHYFLHHFPSWKNDVFTTDDAATIGRELPAFYKRLQKLIHHPTRDRLMRILRPVAVPYRLLRDIIREQGAAALATPETLEAATREATTKRVQHIRQRMNKRAWHSILFLFITKTIIAVLLELPYEIVFLGGAHWLALGVNIAFHPLLLFILATSARLPGQSNSDKLVEQVRAIVTGEEELSTVVVSEKRSYGSLTWAYFALLYVVLLIGIFIGLFKF